MSGELTAPPRARVERAITDLERLNTCDPECEGRCRQCPQDVCNEAAVMLRACLAVMYRLRALEAALRDISLLHDWDLPPEDTCDRARTLAERALTAEASRR